MSLEPQAKRPLILVVEDEMLICLLIESILTDAGYDVAVANSIQEAFDALDAGPIDAAILDLNLKGKKVYPVAERLVAAGIPFAFATGGGHDIEGFPGHVSVAKPFQEHELLATMHRLFPLPAASA